MHSDTFDTPGYPILSPSKQSKHFDAALCSVRRV
jgi:hypothetical protein